MHACCASPASLGTARRDTAAGLRFGKLPGSGDTAESAIWVNLSSGAQTSLLELCPQRKQRQDCRLQPMSGLASGFELFSGHASSHSNTVFADCCALHPACNAMQLPSLCFTEKGEPVSLSSRCTLLRQPVFSQSTDSCASRAFCVLQFNQQPYNTHLAAPEGCGRGAEVQGSTMS